MIKKLVPFLLIFLFSFGSKISFFFIPVYLDLRGFTGLEIGLLVALSSVAAFISFFPSGLVNDRKSIKKPLIVSFILLALFYLGMTLVEGFLLFFLIFLLGGIGLKIGENSLRNYFFKRSIGKSRGEKLGTYQLFVIFGIIAGVLGFSFFVPLTSFDLILQGVGLLFLLLILFVFSIQDTTGNKVKILEYKKDFFRKDVLLFSLVLFLFTLHWGAESTSYGLLLKNYFELDLFTSGIYMAAALVPLGIAAYFFGKRIDRQKSKLKNIIVAGMLISGTMHIVMTFEPLWLSFLARAVHEFGDGLFNLSMMLWITDSFDLKRLAGNASLIMTVTVVAEVVGAVLFSTIGSMFGYQFAFIGSGITSILAAVIFILKKSN